MKKESFIVLILCTLLFVGCATAEERRVKTLQEFTEKLQQNYETYTEEQWEAAMTKYETITESLQEGRYTDEERREIGKLKGQCIAIFTQYAVGVYQQKLEGATNELQGVFEGFLNAFNTGNNSGEEK